MKKFYYLALISLLGWSCRKDQEQLTPIDPVPEAVEKGFRITLEEAARLAAHVISCGEETRSNTLQIKSSELFVARPATRSTGADEVSFYLINYEGGGFAMASTDSRTTPIYAYSERGELNGEDFFDNPGLSVYLDEVAIRLYRDEQENPVAQPASLIVDRKPTPTNPILWLPQVVRDGVTYYLGADDTHTNIGPMLVTEWHQDKPYNRLFEPDIVGCSPLAAGQIMAYHKHPASYGGHTFDWEAMTAVPKFPDTDTSQATYDISWLVWNIGEEAGTNHGTTESSTSTNRIDDGFEAFGYRVGDPTYPDRGRMVGRLSDGYPIWFCGHKSSGAGHAWVVDGFRYTNYVNVYYSIEPPYYEVLRETIPNPNTYYHHNWGGGGTDNGFYLYPNLRGYTEKVRCIHDIVPNR